MATIEHCALVLWGARCDEAAAAIFITTLRAAGLRVWVVGVSGGRIAGVHGLRIQPDLTPSQALPLASHTICVVIPCTDTLLMRFLNDPGVDALLCSAARAQAQFVVSPALMQSPLRSYTNVIPYPPADLLFHFATMLASALAAGTA